MMEKICIIPGTRPEIIKMSPVVRACERWGCSCDVDRVFSGRLGLPDAKCNLDCGSGSGRHGGADRSAEF